MLKTRKRWVALLTAVVHDRSLLRAVRGHCQRIDHLLAQLCPGSISRGHLLHQYTYKLVFDGNMDNTSH